MSFRQTGLVLGSVLLVLGAASPATAQDQPTRQRIESVQRGSLLPAAARLQPGWRRPRQPLLRANVAGRVQRLLARAAEEAAHRPERVNALLAVAERVARRDGIGLDHGEVDKIRTAADRFRRLGKVVRRSDPTIRRLIPREGAWPQETVARYAREYASWQRHYNGARPREILAKYHRAHLRGRVPYWDVDPSLDGVDVVGLTEGSPFVTAEGKVRIFSHYMSRREHRRLISELGRPTGTMAAEMTSSYRTLILYPEGKLPFMLKFSGHEILGEKKRLHPDEVQVSVERTLQLRDHRFLVPEPSGLIARGVTALYRPLPLPSNGQLHAGDRLITWQVLMSQEFRQSPAGQRLFVRHGGFWRWSRSQAVPMLARLLYASMFESFTHLELHSQNVDVLVSERGDVREVFVKDLLDVMHDPAAEAVSGREPLAPLVLHDDRFGDMGEGRTYDLPEFYGAFFGQLHDGARGFHRAVVAHLVTLIRARPPAARMTALPEFAWAADPSQHPFVALDNLRSAYLKARLAETFRPDPAARARFEGARPGHVIADRHPFTITPETEFGFVGTTPTAIVRRGGAIESYSLRFE